MWVSSSTEDPLFLQIFSCFISHLDELEHYLCLEMSNSGTIMFWTTSDSFKPIKYTLSGSLILFNCHLTWVHGCQQCHHFKEPALYFFSFSYLSIMNGNIDCFCSISGTSTCIHLVTNIAPIRFRCTYTCMIRRSSLSSLEWWLNWLYPSWTRSMGNTTQWQVQLSITSNGLMESIN